jgi:hypothetical protein
VDGDGLPEFAVGALANSQRTPPTIDLTVRWPATGALPRLPYGADEGAIMVFGDPPPGDIGPSQAKFTIFGSDQGDRVGWFGLNQTGDLNGDGLADIAYSTYGATVRVLYPCADFGLPSP